jgi:hypothetical protein
MLINNRTDSNLQINYKFQNNNIDLIFLYHFIITGYVRYINNQYGVHRELLQGSHVQQKRYVL